MTLLGVFVANGDATLPGGGSTVTINNANVEDYPGSHEVKFSLPLPAPFHIHDNGSGGELHFGDKGYAPPQGEYVPILWRPGFAQL